MNSNGSLISCAPRLATARSNRDTRGPEVARIAEMLGTPFMPWQRQVVDTALEVDNDGQLVYREVCLTVPRQQGKSTLLVALMLWRALAWGRRQRIAYTAQTGSAARKKLLDDFAPTILDSPLGKYVSRVYRLAADPSVILSNGSRIEAWPSTPTAGHGQTLSGGGFIDEAMADYDDRREQAMLPAMATIPQAQLWIVSTAGTDESTYLLRKVSTGREAISTGLSERIAYFEWSADPDEDPDDEATWHACMPALGTTVNLEAVRHARSTQPDGEFRRAWLNQFTKSDERIIPATVWQAAQADAMPDGRLVFGVDINLDRTAAAIVVADEHGRIELVEHREGVEWIADRLADLRNIHGGNIALDAYGPAGVLSETLEQRKLPHLKYSTREMCYAANLFFDDLMQNKMQVRPHQSLTDAVAVAQKKPMGYSWLWSRAPQAVDVSPLHAASIAYHAARHRNEAIGRPMIL